MDWERVLSRSYPYNFVIGGRGIGKTYGLLVEAIRRDWRYIYLRRTDVELELSVSPDANPYRKINTDLGMDYAIRGRGKLRTIERGEDREIVGYGAALSTFGKLRGVDFSRVGQIIYDEFVPPAGAARLADEGPALMQLYETVNRNRELEGSAPVSLYCLSNATSLASPVLAYLDLIRPIERMLAADREEWSDDARGVYIYLPRAGALAAAKRDTALYRLIGDDDVAAQNLDNRFAGDSMYNVGTRPLREYAAVWSYDDLYAYRHKSRNELYICRSRADCQRFGRDTVEGWRRYIAPYLREDIEAGRVTFADYTAKVEVYNLLRLRLTNA